MEPFTSGQWSFSPAMDIPKHFYNMKYIYIHGGCSIEIMGANLYVIYRWENGIFSLDMYLCDIYYVILCIYITILNQYFLSHYHSSFLQGGKCALLPDFQAAAHVITTWETMIHNVIRVHPRKLTWNLKISTWKRRNIDKPPLFQFHVSFRGCTYSNVVCIPVRFSYISTWASGTGMSCLHQPVRPN